MKLVVKAVADRRRDLLDDDEEDDDEEVDDDEEEEDDDDDEDRLLVIAHAHRENGVHDMDDSDQGSSERGEDSV